MRVLYDTLFGTPEERCGFPAARRNAAGLRADAGPRRAAVLPPSLRVSFIRAMQALTHRPALCYNVRRRESE